ncbi:SGNH/GDSL hydrolase family protein [Pseudochelatococcus sp. B33]
MSAATAVEEGKRHVLAFGDSLTWGARPGGGGRHRFEDRWTSVVEAELPGVRIIAEGLAGRTTSFDDYSAPADRNGTRILPTLLGSHYPLDLVAIMLGTNDLKPHLCGSVLGAAAGMERLVEIVQTYPYGYGARPPRILLISPPHFTRRSEGDGVPAGGRSIAESEKLSAAYEAVADRRGCAFFDAAGVARGSDVDGVHLDAENSRAIGRGVAPVIARLLDL